MRNESTYDIFISYRRNDSGGKAEHLKDLLEPKFRGRISFDRENLTGLFEVSLVRRIDACRDFLLILGLKSLDFREDKFTLEQVELYRYPLEALRMALATIDDVTASRLIHHSDRGCQYCSNEYVSELRKHHVSISMTQSGDPLENAIAERANGILKVEWLYKMKIPTRDECRSILSRIIDFYNTQRPHMSIGMQTPETVHQQAGEQRRCWKNSYAMG